MEVLKLWVLSIMDPAGLLTPAAPALGHPVSTPHRRPVLTVEWTRRMQFKAKHQEITLPLPLPGRIGRPVQGVEEAGARLARDRRVGALNGRRILQRSSARTPAGT